MAVALRMSEKGNRESKMNEGKQKKKAFFEKDFFLV